MKATGTIASISVICIALLGCAKSDVVTGRQLRGATPAEVEVLSGEDHRLTQAPVINSVSEEGFCDCIFLELAGV